jgi:APA family basic amino acid/polyamine antiporter
MNGWATERGDYAKPTRPAYRSFHARQLCSRAIGPDIVLPKEIASPMWFKQMFARKSLETLLAEVAGEHQLRRVLGPVALTAIGVGAIIGAGIFAMTGRVAAEDAGPSIVLSFVVAGIACGFAALCYAEFAAMAPVAGSAYTYTYATLGEVWAWMIGWDLILEYAMSCAVVAAHWAHYLDEFLMSTLGVRIPPQLLEDPFSKVLVNGELVHAWFNLPAIAIMAIVTGVLILGIRESTTANAILVFVKVAVVLFVIALGIVYVNKDNWTQVPVTDRPATDVKDYLARHPDVAERVPPGAVSEIVSGEELLKQHPDFARSLTPAQHIEVAKLVSEGNKWGLLALLGIKHWLQPLDDSMRSGFLPFGLSGLMVGAALVFFAYIGFDAISTHAEEARRPQRDVPLGILLSLAVCTLLYILVSGVITGMEPYPGIDTKAAVAAAFRKRAEVEHSGLLSSAAGIIALGALAGMTSVLLVTFQSQARVFLAISRDGLLPSSIFAAIHPRFRTPHRSTLLTGGIICLVAALTPIKNLEQMVNIGTLMAFALVCASVLILRFTRPDAERPFHCPWIYVVAPLGIAINLLLMLFLPLETWVRLAVWLALGLVIYFSYGRRHSVLGHELQRQLQTEGCGPSNAPIVPGDTHGND